jgi:hypothetical protein
MASIVVAITCAASLALKAFLVWRININWDEFNFLSAIHASVRGERTALLQGAYIHLFEWLVRLAGNEVDQVVAGRICMLVLFALSVVLLWRVAALLVGPDTAIFAPACYLSMSPVWRHGASFRYDSLLLPLTLLAILLVVPRVGRERHWLAAGTCLGVAICITIKAVLLLPVLLLLLALDANGLGRSPDRKLATDVALFGTAAVCTATALLWLHGLGIADHVAVKDQALSAAHKTLINEPYFPRMKEFRKTLHEDRFAWFLILAGTWSGLAQRRFMPAAACALALAPVAFYRNAWPYYYVVMLAPACVLASVTAETVLTGLRDFGAGRLAPVLALLLAGVLGWNSLGIAWSLRRDGQAVQRSVVDAVHRIFPEPVPYIDHSGMISSFRKVNFFMSSWGVDNYLAAKREFAAPLLATYRPPLMLANRQILRPGSVAFWDLLPTDQKTLAAAYIQYWGPIWVAGARFELNAGVPVAITVPFPGRYRLETTAPVLVNGRPAMHGEEIVLEGTVSIAPAAAATDSGATKGRFVIASARPAPPEPAVPIRAVYAEF